MLGEGKKFWLYRDFCCEWRSIFVVSNEQASRCSVEEMRFRNLLAAGESGYCRGLCFSPRYSFKIGQRSSQEGHMLSPGARDEGREKRLREKRVSPYLWGCPNQMQFIRHTG